MIRYYHMFWESLAKGACPLRRSSCAQHSNASAVITLQFPNQHNCTILASKSNDKYRVQGSSDEALTLPLVELLSRLHTFFSGASVAPGPRLQAQIEARHPFAQLLECVRLIRSIVTIRTYVCMYVRVYLFTQLPYPHGHRATWESLLLTV